MGESVKGKKLTEDSSKSKGQKKDTKERNNQTSFFPFPSHMKKKEVCGQIYESLMIDNHYFWASEWQPPTSTFLSKVNIISELLPLSD